MDFREGIMSYLWVKEKGTGMEKQKGRTAARKAGIIALLMLAISIKVSGEEIINTGNTKYGNVETECFWNDGSAVHILESVFHRGDNAFGVVKVRNATQLVVLKENKYVSREWEIWRQK